MCGTVSFMLIFLIKSSWAICKPQNVVETRSENGGIAIMYLEEFIREVIGLYYKK